MNDDYAEQSSSNGFAFKECSNADCIKIFNLRNNEEGAGTPQREAT